MAVVWLCNNEGAERIKSAMDIRESKFNYMSISIASPMLLKWNKTGIGKVKWDQRYNPVIVLEIS